MNTTDIMKNELFAPILFAIERRIHSPPAKWCICLRTVEDSIQRYSTGPGSQAYLSFIEGFIAKASR